MKYYVAVAFDKYSPAKLYGPFASSNEAHDYGKPFAQEGLDVVVQTSEVICDFCSSPDVRWSYTAEDFVIVEPRIEWGSRGGWAACDTCHDFIEKGDREGLAKHSMERFFPTHPEVPNTREVRQVVYPSILAMHEGFFIYWDKHKADKA
jgi:hypothetical protein